MKHTLVIMLVALATLFSACDEESSESPNWADVSYTHNATKIKVGIDDETGKYIYDAIIWKHPEERAGEAVNLSIIALKAMPGQLNKGDTLTSIFAIYDDELVPVGLVVRKLNSRDTIMYDMEIVTDSIIVSDNSESEFAHPEYIWRSYKNGMPHKKVDVGGYLAAIKDAILLCHDIKKKAELKEFKKDKKPQEEIEETPHTNIM